MRRKAPQRIPQNPIMQTRVTITYPGKNDAKVMAEVRLMCSRLEKAKLVCSPTLAIAVVTQAEGLL